MTKNIKGFGLVTLIISFCIVAFLAYIAIKKYYGQGSVNPQTKEVYEEAGIVNPASEVAVYQATKSKIQDMQKQIMDSENQALKELEKY